MTFDPAQYGASGIADEYDEMYGAEWDTAGAVEHIAAAGRRFAQKARAQANQGAAEQSVAEGLSDHVIIAGFGRVGQTVARVLELEGIPWVALDRDPAIVGHCRGAGLPTIFGQADRPEILELAGAARASLGGSRWRCDCSAAYTRAAKAGRSMPVWRVKSAARKWS